MQNTSTGKNKIFKKGFTPHLRGVKNKKGRLKTEIRQVPEKLVRIYFFLNTKCQRTRSDFRPKLNKILPRSIIK